MDLKSSIYEHYYTKIISYYNKCNKDNNYNIMNDNRKTPSNDQLNSNAM